MFRILMLGFVLSVFSFLHTPAVMAAPQVLAVLSTGKGAVIKCESGICTTSLSTYCLQRHRDPPDIGAPYHAADLKKFTLVLEMQDGTLSPIEAPTMVSFRSERGYASVEAVLDERVLKDTGAVSARLIVADDASLVPDPQDGDLEPLSPAEIALAVGPLRALGSKLVDNSEHVKKAHALGVMLRAIPEWRGWPQTTRTEMWDMIDAVAQQEGVSDDDYALIKSEFNACADSYEQKKYFGIGYCIRQQHDHKILKLNKTYWNAQTNS